LLSRTKISSYDGIVANEKSKKRICPIQGNGKIFHASSRCDISSFRSRLVMVVWKTYYTQHMFFYCMRLDMTVVHKEFLRRGVEVGQILVRYVPGNIFVVAAFP
jgi:hypothetical protein